MTSLAIENVNGLPILVAKGERSEVYTVLLPPDPVYALKYAQFCALVETRRDQAIRDAVWEALRSQARRPGGDA